MKKIGSMLFVLLVIFGMFCVTVCADSNEKEYYPGTLVITYESVTGIGKIDSYKVGDTVCNVYPLVDSNNTAWQELDYVRYMTELEQSEKWIKISEDISVGETVYTRDGYVLQLNLDTSGKKISISFTKDNFEKYETIDNSTISVYINGKKVSFDVEPQLINGRTMVPMRAIFEALECDVEWDNDNQQITAAKEEDDVVTTIVMQIDKNSMMVDEEEKVLDVAPTLVDGRTLVPVRAISEALGVNVEWHNPIQAVDIYGEKANTTVLYNENDDTVNSPFYLVKKYQHAGYSSDRNLFYMTMYAIDGKTITVKKSEKELYEAQGWRVEYVYNMYSSDGRVIGATANEIEKNKKVGWSTVKFHWDRTSDMLRYGKEQLFETLYVPDSLKINQVLAGVYEFPSSEYFIVLIDYNANNRIGGSVRGRLAVKYYNDGNYGVYSFKDDVDDGYVYNKSNFYDRYKKIQ